MDDARLLEAGIRQLQVTADASQRNALLQFVRLLHKWNRRYSLTAVSGTDAIISRHVFDSLTAVPYIGGRRVIDVGSGAGLPGIPLAILCRDREFLLLDANSKKTRFVQQAIIEIGLKNVQVCRQRVEQYVPPRGFDTVVSRAFAPSEKVLASVDHLMTRGRVVLMLGKQARVRSLPSGYHLTGMYPVCVPNTKASRHIATIEKCA